MHFYERQREYDYLAYNRGVFVVGQSKEYIPDFKGLRDVATESKFWPKYAKKLTKMAMTSVVWQEHWADTRSTERISCFRKKLYTSDNSLFYVCVW